jgi:hypothetical protein
MSQEQNIKEIIKAEYLKCSQDPEHFIRKYCMIQHPTRGRMSFNLYPFQAKVLGLWKNHPFDLILKSRQLGISTLVAGYSLWIMLFHKDKNILCIATKEKTAKNMVTKVHFMYNNLPSWLKETDKSGKYKKPLEESKLTLKLNNGSQIQAVSAAGDSGRSEACSLLIIDEAAFIDDIETIWASAQQTLATGGGAIVLSTPNGTGNWFHKMWERAESRENSFLPIKLPWHVHPERDQAWRDKQDVELGDPRLAAQECDCDFNTSGDTVFYADLLDFYTQSFVQDPIEKRGQEQNYWFWQYPDFTRSYMVVADVARGDGKDNSAFHVIDIETNEQVAEYKGQLGTTEYAYALVAAATEWNNALLVIENTGIGWNTVQKVIELDYKNLYYSSKSGNTDTPSYMGGYHDLSKETPGFTMSLTSRPLAIGKLREFINEKLFIIRSRRMIAELKVLIWKNGRAEAQSGYNDDLVMAGSMGMYIRDTAIKIRQQTLELTKAALGNFSSGQSVGGFNSSNTGKNPYMMNVNGKQENYGWMFGKNKE